MFNSEDIKYFGTDWIDQPCKRRNVRIIMPHLPHEAYGLSKGIRRIILF